MNRQAFQQLAETRIADARALFGAGRYDAAFYLAGYAVECALKACIAKKTREHDFPPKDGQKFYKHDLEALLELALREEFKQDQKTDSILASNWELVTRWSEQSRYELRAAEEAAELARNILKAIEDPEHGVLKCLSKYW